MSEEKINVRIKLLPPANPGGEPRAVTTRFWIRGNVDVRAGARPLEPNEVVALDAVEARIILAKRPYELEQTFDPPTRPLFFRNQDEADMTSQSFNPATAGRAEEAKVAMKAAMEEANTPEAKAEAQRLLGIEEREEAVRQREIELGLIENPNELEDRLEEDLEGYVPANNTVITDADANTLREEAEEPAPTREVVVAEAITADPVTAETPNPAPRRRRRRAAAAA